MVKKNWVQLFSIVFLFFTNAEAQVINRTLLTVQDDVYTTAQAELILAVWAKVQGDKLTPSLIKENNVNLNVVGGQQDILAAYKKWPREAQELFFLAVTWWEIKRLSLFTLPVLELEKRTQELKTRLLESSIDEPLRAFLRAEGTDLFRAAVEQALRAQNYLKVRGDLEKNTSLLNVAWYWHSSIPRSSK